MYILYKFHKRMQQFKWKDLGLVQKMIYFMIFSLVLFNDPLCLTQPYFKMLYAIL